MPYRNKTYVCFDGDNDMKYYDLMRAWKQNDNTDFNFYDAHDLNTARDTSQEESIKRQLKTRLQNTKIFVVLLGEHTKYLTKFVKWEMEQAIALELPIIVVNVNKIRGVDNERFPSALRGYPTVSISFNVKIMQYALERWAESHRRHLSNGENSAYFYVKNVYDTLGL